RDARRHDPPRAADDQNERVRRVGRAQHWSSMSERISVAVDGIDDPEIRAQVEHIVRESFREMSLPGAWRVSITPSIVGGRWDVRVEGVDVRHTMSIAVPARLLPTLLPRRLVESLDRTLAKHRDYVIERTLRRVI